MNGASSSTRQRVTKTLLIVAIGILVGLLYVPLLYWLGRSTLHTQQLVNGAFLVLMSLVICVRQAVGKLRVQPEFNNFGIILLALGFFYLWAGEKSRYWTLPLVLLSFCFSFAGIMSLLFGKRGVTPFLPALGAFFVFSVLVGLFPTLDWPLREMAGSYAGRFLAWMNVPAKLVLAAGQPPKLILAVNGELFEVATECNGFGLLTSSLIVATVLALLYDMPGLNRVGLLALAVPLAIACNFLRIVSICLLAPRTKLPYGLVHETVGLLFYFVALGLIWRIAAWTSTTRRGSGSA